MTPYQPDADTVKAAAALGARTALRCKEQGHDTSYKDLAAAAAAVADEVMNFQYGAPTAAQALGLPSPLG